MTLGILKIFRHDTNSRKNDPITFTIGNPIVKKSNFFKKMTFCASGPQILTHELPREVGTGFLLFHKKNGALKFKMAPALGIDDGCQMVRK